MSDRAPTPPLPSTCGKEGRASTSHQPMPSTHRRPPPCQSKAINVTLSFHSLASLMSGVLTHRLTCTAPTCGFLLMCRVEDLGLSCDVAFGCSAAGTRCARAGPSWSRYSAWPADTDSARNDCARRWPRSVSPWPAAVLGVSVSRSRVLRLVKVLAPGLCCPSPTPPSGPNTPAPLRSLGIDHERR